MASYVIDFEAWKFIEADNSEHAYAIAQEVINTIQEAIDVEMVVKDGGIEEA